MVGNDPFQLTIPGYSLSPRGIKARTGSRNQKTGLLASPHSTSCNHGPGGGGLHMVLAFIEESGVSIILSEPASCA